jgi:hypothetical protein
LIPSVIAGIAIARTLGLESRGGWQPEFAQIGQKFIDQAVLFSRDEQEVHTGRKQASRQ